ncbi:MAG: hypothetical protein J07AB43_02250 [Candidatus Nanosalina sp. J07AB43]|nr:MAG: hypothetical protein J07AB43_02250 [Candidatus Nanosalina sp. J07AB43]
MKHSRDYNPIEREPTKEFGDWDHADDLGLCVNCCDNPINPGVSEVMCLDCLMSMGSGWLCSADNCPNAVTGSFRSTSFCEIHLIDVIHKEYQDYCETKTTLMERQREVGDTLSNMEQDPRNVPDTALDLSSSQSSIYAEWESIQKELADLEVKKSRIKSAMKHVDQPFPNGFDASF